LGSLEADEQLMTAIMKALTRLTGSAALDILVNKADKSRCPRCQHAVGVAR
jgi:hypothetical protein